MANPPVSSIPFHNTKTILCLSALAMSVGWGWRGDYGHEAGAMVPGALLALAICLTANRADWLERAPLLATLGAIGWAFGGQMSYGIVIGYTAHLPFGNVLYGYAGLFLIGALWGSTGAAILALGVTYSRAQLESFALPVSSYYIALMACNLFGLTDKLSERWSFYDTDWVAAVLALLVALAYGSFRPASRQACLLIGALGLGWLLGLAVLTGLLGWRMTPPRSDNWAGAFGLWCALVVYLFRTQNRAALLMAGYGWLAGGIGFAVGDLFNMAGRAKWGIIWRSWTLSGLDSWKWMEQGFGLIMGFGVALGFARLARHLAPPVERDTKRRWQLIAPLFLLILMPWENLSRNVTTWAEQGFLGESLFRLSPTQWIFTVAVLLAALLSWLIAQDWRGALHFWPASAVTPAQGLFLWILWFALVADFTRALPSFKHRGVLFVHLSFWLTALACTWTVLRYRPAEIQTPNVAPESSEWRGNKWFWLAVGCVLPLLLLLTRLTLAMHSEPLPGSHLRWPAS